MKGDKKTRKVLRDGRLRLRTSAEMDERLVGEMLSAMKRAKSAGGNEREQGIWRIIMGSGIMRAAVIGMVLVIVAICVGYFGGSPDGASVAWADVMEAMREVKSVHVKATLYPPGEESITEEIYARISGYLRIDEGDNSTVIDDGSERLTISHKEKEARFTASLQDYRPVAEHYAIESAMKPVEEWAEELSGGTALERVDEESSDEKVAYRFKYQLGNSEYGFPQTTMGTLVIEAGSNLLLSVTITSLDGSVVYGEVVYEYGEIDDEIFAMVVPDGYEVLERKERAKVSGRVVDGDGKGVEGAVVKTVYGNSNWGCSVVSGVDGEYEIELVPYELRLHNDIVVWAYSEDESGWAILTIFVNRKDIAGYYLYNRDNREISKSGVEIRLEKGREICGRVTDRDGKGICGAKVEFVGRIYMHGHYEFGGVTEAITDSEGRYFLRNLPNLGNDSHPSEYRVKVKADGYYPVYGYRVEFDEGEYLKDVDLAMYRAGITVRGIVKGPGGEVLGGRGVTLGVDGDYEMGSLGKRTNADGRFEFKNYAAGEKLVVKAKFSEKNHNGPDNWIDDDYRFYSDVEKVIEVVDGKMEYEVELVAEEPNCVVEVEVVDGDGERLIGFPVILENVTVCHGLWEAGFWGMTDGDGVYRFEGVPHIIKLLPNKLPRPDTMKVAAGRVHRGVNAEWVMRIDRDKLRNYGELVEAVERWSEYEASYVYVCMKEGVTEYRVKIVVRKKME